MKRIGVLLMILFFNGCATYKWNIDWARENNIPIIEVKVPEKSWPYTENFLDTYIVNPNAVIVFDIPFKYWDEVLIKYKAYLIDVCFFYEPNVIFRMEKYPCLEHELGHLREYLEGIPYHSKYAPNNASTNWNWFMNPAD